MFVVTVSDSPANWLSAFLSTVVIYALGASVAETAAGTETAVSAVFAEAEVPMNAEDVAAEATVLSAAEAEITIDTSVNTDKVGVAAEVTLVAGVPVTVTTCGTAITRQV
jgi:hypothetical protein